MTINQITRITLRASASYDIVLGGIVLLFHPVIYKYFHITPPNHLGYIQMLALFVVVLGVMQAMAAPNPAAKTDLIICSLLMKVSYCVVVFGHLVCGAIPGLWVVFALIDLLVAVILILFLESLHKEATQREAATG